MQIVSLVWGILALVGVLAAFAPFFGALNWIEKRGIGERKPAMKS